MNLAELSIKRPIFITCIILLSLFAGCMSIKKLGVDLFPDVTFPVVFVSTPYPGAGPSEIETLVSKPIEDELSTLSGIKRLSSISQEGVSTVVAEFTLETDIKYAEQQVRDRMGSVKRKLPNDILEPTIRRIDPSDQPILILSVKANLPDADLYDLANETIRPQLEQINQVGLVEILGGRKREIHVALDRNELKARELSVEQVIQKLQGAGEDIPSGKKNEGTKEVVFRTLGQFQSLTDIENKLVNFFGNDVPVKISQLGKVMDGLVEEKSRAFFSGEKTLFIYVFKQSGANTVAVVDALKARVGLINTKMAKEDHKGVISTVRDGSLWIRANLLDVEESIFLGILLAVIVVYFFLGNIRSTFITGLALPNSLIGAFIMMAMFGFTINIMTLLALSLSVGLLIDDAIVVRENIFRHIEMGKKPIDAALIGTNEVRLAVIATTLTVIAVFGPLGFLKGVTGQFFKQFGLTVCFAMLISMFDALTIAPMLSAYFAGRSHHKSNSKLAVILRWPLTQFQKFQNFLDRVYEKLLHFSTSRPLLTLILSGTIFLFSLFLTKFVTKTFLPTQDAGEFTVALDLPPGTSLDAMSKASIEVDKVVRSNPEVEHTALTVGSRDGDSNMADIYVKLVYYKKRSMNTSQFKDHLREQLKPFANTNPRIKDYDAVGGGMRPFAMNLAGLDQKELEDFSLKVLERLKKYPGLKDVDVNFRVGKPEFQIRPLKNRADMMGISVVSLGKELRNQVEGFVAAKYRVKGMEYDVRVRLQEDQRNLKAGFNQTYVPNINNSLVKLSDVAEPFETTGPSKITRQDRNRYVQINADISPGAGLGNIMSDIDKIFESDPELKLPDTIRHAYIGQAENFKELGESVVVAMGAGILFIFLVLASLYESFVTPFTIMLALPLAICGSLLGLLVMNESLNIFSMIGVIMLLGVATKNSILLVDYANQKVLNGMDRTLAIIEAGKVRLRPILMTTMALIAGTLPIALGLNEASKQRTSMGVAIIGGLITSTLLTLVVIPATYSYLDRFRVWSSTGLKRIFSSND